MSAAGVVADAVYWYDRDECPGCRASLRAVAGRYEGHVPPGGGYGPGSRQTAGSEGRPLNFGRGDGDRCPVTSDQLAALCHIAVGMVSAGSRPPADDPGAGQTPNPRLPASGLPPGEAA